MHAVNAGEFGKRCFTMQHQAGVVPPRHRQQRARQRHLLVLRQILFAQADPAAARRQRRTDDLGERAPRLMAIGDQKQWRNGKFHRVAAFTALLVLTAQLVFTA